MFSEESGSKAKILEKLLELLTGLPDQEESEAAPALEVAKVEVEPGAEDDLGV